MNPATAFESTPSAPLTVLHAKVHGQGKRERLAQALSRVPLDGLGLSRDEFLYVPHLKSSAALQQYGAGHRFAQTVSRALHDINSRAVLDPDRFTGMGAICRFSSEAKFVVWLLDGFLSKDPDFRKTLIATTGHSEARSWWRASIICNGSLIVQLCNALLSKGQAAAWISRLSSDDLNIAEAALQQKYGVTASRDIHTEAEYFADGVSSQKPVDPLVERSFSCDPQLAFLQPEHRRLTAAVIYLGQRPTHSRGAFLQRFIAAFLSRKPEWESFLLPLPKDASVSAEQKTNQAGAAVISSNSSMQSKKIPKAAGSNERITAGDVQPVKSADEASEDVIPIGVEQGSAPKKSQYFHDLQSPEEGSHDDVGDPGSQSASMATDNIVEFGRAREFESEHCGLFFIINALIRIGLAEDFTQPRVKDDDLSPFAVINYLGRYWFGHDYAGSQLNHALSRHSGKLAPQRRFDGFKYLEDETAGRNNLMVRDGRSITIWHPDGFPLLDRKWRRIRRGQNALRGSLKKHKGQLGQGRLVRAKSRFRLPQSSTMRWTACLAKLLEWRLGKAASEYALAPDDLKIPGHVRMIDEKISVHMALKDLPIAIRLAGLDRDPGWVMKEGRSLAFIFE